MRTPSEELEFRRLQCPTRGLRGSPGISALSKNCRRLGALLLGLFAVEVLRFVASPGPGPRRPRPLLASASKHRGSCSSFPALWCVWSPPQRIRCYRFDRLGAGGWQSGSMFFASVGSYSLRGSGRCCRRYGPGPALCDGIGVRSVDIKAVDFVTCQVSLVAGWRGGRAQQCTAITVAKSSFQNALRRGGFPEIAESFRHDAMHDRCLTAAVHQV